MTDPPGAERVPTYPLPVTVIPGAGRTAASGRAASGMLHWSMISRIPYALPLLAAAALLVGCDRAGAPPRAAVEPPAGISALIGETARHVVFEGERIVDGRPFVDGRVWLLDRNSGEVRLLTSPDLFGENFFASAALLTPDGRAVLVEVNLEDSGGNLYLIGIDDGGTRFIADLPGMGLSDFVAQTAVVSPDGGTLAFSAWTLEAVESPEADEHHLSRLGVYSLDLEARRPAATLTELHLAPPDAAPQLLYPHFESGGSIVVAAEPPLVRAHTLR